MSARLEPDAEAIGAFVDALFRYADDGSYVSLRAFDQFDDSKPPTLILPVRVNGAGYAEVTETAIRAERDLANRRDASVFAPPIATFSRSDSATEAALANGLAISVELDQGNSAEARQRLEGLLGPATVVIASGGIWKDPTTGAISPRLHLHWRLSEPTKEAEDHSKLKRARHLSCLLVGADATAKTPVHPLRWPGTWHRKAEPKMVRIVAINAEAEVHLVDAIEALETAVEAAGISEFGSAGPRQSGEPQAPIPLLESALAAIPNTDADWDTWNTTLLLLYRASGPSDEGLRIGIAWSRKSPKHQDGACESRWAHFATSPPTRGGAGTLFMRAKAAGWKRPGREAPPPPDGEDDYGSGQSGAQEHPGHGTEAASLGIWNAGDDDYVIPPRGWLLGNAFCRRFLSSVIADGGVGKTALRIAQLISLATGRSLTGEHVFCRCRVLIVSLEDDRDELRRRVLAVLKHHHIDPAEVKGWLFLSAPNGLKLAEMKDGTMQASKLEDLLRAAVAEHAIDVVSLDPFVKAHGVGENDNNAVDFVCCLLTAIAHDADCAVDIPHHTRKGKGDGAGDSDRGRGASSMKDAARLVYTLTPMTPEEAEQFGLQETDRRSLVRLDSGKVNIAPPSSKATWFRIIGVPLENGSELYPRGDNVQTVDPWQPPDTWAELDHPLLNRILDQIDAGLQ
ncbi:MAG: AAA family ATPase, partial [Bradyrhizobium sp.]